MELVLASASPRRLELVRRLGLRPQVCPARLDERALAGEAPGDTVLRLAAAKARQVAAPLAGEPLLVLAADTLVTLDGLALGKPADARAAAEMLRRLRGRDHEVLTGVRLVRCDTGAELGERTATVVRFRDFSDATLAAYAACGEPLDKAGGYAIQGRGARLVDGVDGSWFNVVGLPVERMHRWWAALGLDLDEALNGDYAEPACSS